MPQAQETPGRLKCALSRRADGLGHEFLYVVGKKRRGAWLAAIVFRLGILFRGIEEEYYLIPAYLSFVFIEMCPRHAACKSFIWIVTSIAA